MTTLTQEKLKAILRHIRTPGNYYTPMDEFQAIWKAAQAEQREVDAEIASKFLDDPFLSGHGYANGCAAAIRNQQEE